MSFNLFGDDDGQQSKFVTNLKKETYDPLLITFDENVTYVPAQNRKNAQPSTPKILTQSMLTSSTSELSLQQQQMTQYASSSSCDYVVYVPTSFMVSKEQIEEFYKSKQKIKQTSTMNAKDAAVSIFMNKTMFEEFVKFVKKPEHARELLIIAKSYETADETLKTFKTILTSVGLNDRFRLVYIDATTPVLTNFYHYIESLYVVVISGTGYSVGRIPNYIPALNSNIASTQKVPQVAYAINPQPSYNVEIMHQFWTGIITGQRLPNRGPLSSTEKFRVIQDNTRLYTFRSTSEYSMNYDALLKQLYYKYPCYLNGESANNLYIDASLKALLKYNKAELKTLHANSSDNEVLYAICGPVYFDYTWIFKQNPALIKHILGEDTDTSDKTNRWEERIDPLTENRHYVNRNPSNPNYPKTRFDVNPDTSPLPANCKELYVSPSDAKTELNVTTNHARANVFTNAVAATGAWANTWNACNGAAILTVNNSAATLPMIYDWTKPGYYRYEITRTVTNQTSGQTAQLTYKFTQLMRPPTQTNGVQDYTEPNLPTAYPPPLRFVVPEMRGPENSFMIHACLPDLSSPNSPSYETFMSGSRLNGNAYEKHMYNVMQLIFESAIKNAKANGAMSAPSNRYYGSTPEPNKICIKIMAVGYGDTNQNLKAISNDDDRTFIGNAFFNAVRDYSMLYESNNVHVAIYYDGYTQSAVKQQYDEYTRRRESIILRSRSQAFDSDLKLTIQPLENFFTLRFPFTTTRRQLRKTDMLYFVDYCSSPRAFIGNSGEIPDNMNDVQTQLTQLNQCLDEAVKPIRTLYTSRDINAKITVISQNLQYWNNPSLFPKQLVDSYNALKDNYLTYNANDTVFNALTANPHTNINVSWWQGHDSNTQNSLPRNAHMSSFDEHVLILYNLLNNRGTSRPMYTYTQAKKSLHCWKKWGRTKFR